MSNLLEGEYVHVPSGTTMYQMDTSGSVLSFKHVSKPVVLMFLGQSEHSSFCKVFYRGDIYLIDRHHVYKLGEQSD